MALIIEDGTGLINADSLISLADVDAYHADRANTAWTSIGKDAASIALKEGLIRQANDFMVQRYRSRWKGWRLTFEQSLDWPRTGVQLDDTFLLEYLYPTDIPIQVKHAVAELALRAVSGALSPDVTQALASRQVGPIKTTYDKYSPQQPRYVAVDQLLAPFMAKARANVQLVR